MRGLLTAPSAVSNADEKAETPKKAPESDAKPKRKRRWLRRIGVALGVLLVLLVAVRLAMPAGIKWYVNRVIDRDPLYDGRIGDIDVHLYRGAYTINDIRINKVTGNVPAPLFNAKQIDLAIQWDALWHGKIVGRILIDQPQLNFVDGESDGEDQTGAGGPWLEMLHDLFPFKINSCVVRDGSVHFRAVVTNPPVDLSLDDVQASIENLTNIRDEVTPLVATVKATALAMGQAKLEYEMKINPFSYKPTFQMALRLLGLDVTKTNDLTRAYGKFDFEDGWFDLVVELDAKEGQLEGYVKPMFRNIEVLDSAQDKHKNVFRKMYEGVIGGAAKILENHKGEVATVTSLKGPAADPKADTWQALGGLLKNAFVKAILPGFRREIHRVEPVKYRAAMKREKKDTEARRGR